MANIYVRAEDSKFTRTPFELTLRIQFPSFVGADPQITVTFKQLIFHPAAPFTEIEAIIEWYRHQAWEMPLEVGIVFQAVERTLEQFVKKVHRGNWTTMSRPGWIRDQRQGELKANIPHGFALKGKCIRLLEHFIGELFTTPPPLPPSSPPPPPFPPDTGNPYQSPRFS